MQTVVECQHGRPLIPRMKAKSSYGTHSWVSRENDGVTKWEVDKAIITIPRPFSWGAGVGRRWPNQYNQKPEGEDNSSRDGTPRGSCVDDRVVALLPCDSLLRGDDNKVSTFKSDDIRTSVNNYAYRPF